MTHIVTGLLIVGALAAAGPRGEGYVDLPLRLLLELLDRQQGGEPEPAPPSDLVYLDRRLDGAFRKGLLSATLVTRFEVLAADGHVRVPVFDAGASPRRVRMDGRPTSLVEVDGMYTVGVDGPGVHQVEIAFHRGEEEDRFSRRLQVALPAGGVTRLSLLVPEPDIDARLEHGTLTASTAQGGGTLLEGFLDASGSLDLTWSRRVTHDRRVAASLEARAHALFTVGEALVEGVAVYDLDVRAGETDRVELRLPAELEIVKVEGDAVLQWRTDGAALVVLLRYLVDDRARITVRFGYAVEPGARVPLRLPLPPAGVPLAGAAGVRAPAGLALAVTSVADARPLAPRDLPTELAEMSSSPLLLGFDFAAPPSIALSVSRLEPVELTSTLIDGVEASTVLIEDGTEVTKLRLHIRNNTRQYLRVRLPDGSTLTHALLDGEPVRPALGRDEGGEALLFTLRQSERIDPGEGRTHEVEEGDTLGDIAHLYYSDPGKWRVILEANESVLASPTAIRPGQRLVIPSVGPVTVEESSFVLELAYRRRGEGLGALGRAALVLPELDVDALGVTWHLYLPESVVPLDFTANLTQESHLRYGAIRRLHLFLDEALGGRRAWAGESGYESILTKRKAIYRDEAIARGAGDVSPGAFPLVGERYRFRRILVDREQPRITFVYARRGLVSAARWGAFALAAGLGLLLLGTRRGPWRWVAALALGGLALVVAHHVPGVHRRLVWGVDLALLVTVVRLRRARGPLGVGELLRSPWHLPDLLTLRSVAGALGLVAAAHVAVLYPLLLSLVGTAVLALLWRRWRRPAAAAAGGAS